MLFRNLILSIALFLIGAQRVLGLQEVVFSQEISYHHAVAGKYFSATHFSEHLCEIGEIIEDELDDEQSHIDDLFGALGMNFGFQKQWCDAYFKPFYLHKSCFVYSGRYLRLKKSVFQI